MDFCLFVPRHCGEGLGVLFLIDWDSGLQRWRLGWVSMAFWDGTGWDNGRRDLTCARARARGALFTLLDREEGVSK